MGKYYSLGTTFDNIRLGLLDYYGTYDAVSNPTGVDVKESSSTLLIFGCSAISDKLIKITGMSDLFGYYGDVYSGSGVITNQICFTALTAYGSTTAAHMVCADNTMLINNLVDSTSVDSKLMVIGKLTNGAYAVLGLIGDSNYVTGALGYLTADQTTFRLSGLESAFNVGAKRLKMPFALITSAGALNTGSDLITFADLYSVSAQLGSTVCSRGTGYFMTTSGMYNNDSMLVRNSMLMETTN